MTHQNLTCSEVDELLGEYLEGALDDSVVAAIELHLSGCSACSATARDIEQLVRAAAALPELAPSRDLWPSIAQRIEAPVVAFGARTAIGTSSDGNASRRRLRRAAMAAGLVGIAALSSYVLADRASVFVVAGSGPAGSATAGSESTSARPVPTPEPPSGSVVASAPESAGAASGVSPSSLGDRAFSAPLGTSASPALTPVRREAPPAARETFSNEISVLRGIVSERRDELDPRTIAILESSISTIDSAIAEARRALESDPASRFLSTQLDKALEKKLGLLRTAALLPART